MTGCAYKITPLKGLYSDKPFEIVSDKSKDRVWDKLIDFFAQKGLSIKIIDRRSGLIISDKSALTWTFEDSKGKLINPSAWIVIEKTVDPGPNKVIKPSSVAGDWNVRIKDLPNNKTVINVNLVNIRAKRESVSKYGISEYEIKALSTGNFEKLISDIIK
ncbi:MAG: hypothetical protein WKF97_19400 [Chitinophagaceae bacterium]